MNGNVVTATIIEASGTPDKHHVIDRLNDWQARVHALYDAVQRSLGNSYSFDRSGKHLSREGIIERVGLKPQEIAKLDILRIEHDGCLAAILQPRGLWIIGANGRVDIVVTPGSGGRRLFSLIDHSLPLSGASDWRIVRPSDRLQQPPFYPERFRELLE